MRPGARRVLLWVGTSLGVLVIVVMVLRFDPDAVLLPLLRSHPGILLVVGVCVGAVQYLNAVSPVVLLGEPAGGGIGWHAQVRVFLALQPLALVAPGRLADLGAVPLLKGHHPPGAVASALLVDRLITMFFLLLLTPLALRFVWLSNATTAANISAGVFLVLVMLLPFVLLNQTVRDVVNRRVLRYWPSLLQGFGAHTEALLHASRARLLVNLALTAVKTLVSASIIVLLAMNVGLTVGVPTALWMSILIQLATSVPISVQGIGVAEGSLVLLFAANGLPEALALSVGVSGRILVLPVMAFLYVTMTVPVLGARLKTGADPGRT